MRGGSGAPPRYWNIAARWASACRSRRSRRRAARCRRSSRMRISVPRKPRPTLPGCCSHSSPRIAHEADALGHAVRHGRSARRRAGRSSGAPATARSTAAPCRIHTMLDRSRSSTPGRSAMRWSISVVAVKVVTPWRSMRSTMRAASNFCEHDEVVAGEQAEQRGEPVGVVHRRHHQDDLRARHRRPRRSANGMPTISSKTPGLSIRMTLGVPVEPLLQMPLVCGDTTDGQRRGGRSSAVASSHGRSSAPTRHAVDHLEHAARAPSRGGPSAPAPARRRASTPPARSSRTRASCAGRRRRACRARRRAVWRARAICVERRCSSGQVTTVSAPSIATTRTHRRRRVVLGERAIRSP